MNDSYKTTLETLILIEQTIFLDEMFSFRNIIDRKGSQTCVHRPSSGAQNSGRCWQVVIVQRYLYAIYMENYPKIVAVVGRWSLFRGTFNALNMKNGTLN